MNFVNVCAVMEVVKKILIITNIIRRLSPLRKVNFATKAQKHKEFTKLYFTGYLFFVYLRAFES